MLGIGWGVMQLAATKAGGFRPEALQPAALYNVAAPGACWQDMAGTVPALAAGDPVARLSDLSGRGRHLVQSVAQARPLLQAEGSRRWLAFDGIDDALLGGPVHGEARTIIMGFAPLAAGICSYGANGASNARSLIGVSASGVLAGGVGGQAQNVISAGAGGFGGRRVALLRYDPATVLLRRDGGAGGTYTGSRAGSVTPSYPSSMGALGSSGTPAVNYANSHIGIVIDFARALSDEECALAEAWVNERWEAY